MPTSDLKPDEIFLDYVKEGRCRLLVCWDIIQQVQKNEQISVKPSLSWSYSERIIWWILPEKYDSLDKILTYLDANKSEIINWARATEVSYDGTVSKDAMKKKEV